MRRLKAIFRPLYAPAVRGYRRRLRLRDERAGIQAQAAVAQQAGHPIKVILGAGITRYAGWIATDIPAFDILKHEHWALLFQPNTIERMLAEHVFEHLTTEQFVDFLRIARIYLNAGGRVRIAVPDGYHPDPDYIEHVRPQGSGEGADDHKVLYTCDLISALLEGQGYACRLLEYFDAAGAFCQQPWHPDDGFVARSAANDPRNADGKKAYTSLIVDCWVRG